MKLLILVSLVFVIVVSGCVSSESINKRIADSYRGIKSLSYDMDLVRTDEYDKPYTAYGIVEDDKIAEPKILSDSSERWVFKVLIEKPDKKSIFTSGTNDDHINGGQLINGTWYFSYRKAGSYGDTEEICNKDTFYMIPDRARGADLSADSSDPNICPQWVTDSIWKVPSNIDNSSMFNVNISQEKLNNRDVIKVSVESVDGGIFYISEREIPYQKIILWLDTNDFKLLKYQGTLKKSSEASENSIGIKTIYTATLKNMVFNPKIPAEKFQLDLNKYKNIVYIREKSG
ncbi:MAG: hypothetical protein HYT71_02495 [Candidatus Aenigmarchaeota archaeon]|nr:hypothetical protein [Candidatus Aenigmarchaeota archaeon]